MSSNRIIMVPFFYRIEGVLKRARNAQVHHVIDAVPVQIEEVSPDEMPVVLESSFGSYRRHNGVLLQRMQNFDWPRRAPIKSSELSETIDRLTKEVKETLRDVHGIKEMVEDLPFAPGDVSIVREVNFIEQYEFRSITSNDMEERRQEAAERWAHGLVIMGDEVWLQAREPVLNVRTDGYRRNGDTFVYLVQHEDWIKLTGQNFRMDHLEDALAMAERMAGGHRVGLGSEWNLLDDSGWGFDEIEHTTRAAAAVIASQLRDMSQRALWMSREFFDALVAFRDMNIETEPVASLARAISDLGYGAKKSDHPNAELLASWIAEEAENMEWRWERAGISMYPDLGELKITL